MRLDDYDVPNKNLIVAAVSESDEELLKGETSSTATAFKGFKAKVLSVTLRINFKDAPLLKKLVQQYEKVDSDGKRKVFTVLDDLADAYGIHQAKFHGALRSVKVTKGQAWDVSFRLMEHVSIPERKESRATTTTAPGTGANGTPITAEELIKEAADTVKTEFEELLQIMEDGAAYIFGDEDEAP